MQAAAIEFVPQVTDGAAIEAAAGKGHLAQLAAVQAHPFAEGEGETALAAAGGFEDGGIAGGFGEQGLA